MKLKYKIVSSFIVVIVLMAIASVISTSYVLGKRTDDDIQKKAATVATLSEKIYKSVADKDSNALTLVLFDEKKARLDEVEYYVVFNPEGNVMAHTYVTPVPKTLKDFEYRDFGTSAPYEVKQIKNSSEGLDVYDISVPIKEGIKQVGVLHVGVKSDYLVGLQNKLINLSMLFSVLLGFLAILIASLLTHFIVKPIKELTVAVNRITNGEFDVVLPDIKTKDEIQELNSSIEMLVTGYNMLRKKG
jgi:nitrogen fixation/metabolism regulation signal transduction histidine kinase